MLVKNYIGMNPAVFSGDDQRQIRFVLGLMVDGKAGNWSEQYYYERTHHNKRDVPWKHQTFEKFEKEIMKQFVPVDEQINAQREFYEIRQGKKTATDFNLDFQRLALLAEVSDNKALMEQYKRGLNESLAREIWIRIGGPPETIEEWYTEAVRRDTVRRQADAIWPKQYFRPQNNQPQYQPRNNGRFHRTINEIPMESYDYQEPQTDYYYPEEPEDYSQANNRITKNPIKNRTTTSKKTRNTTRRYIHSRTSRPIQNWEMYRLWKIRASPR